MRFPKMKKADATVYFLLVLSLAFFFGLQIVAKTGSADLKREMLQAARLMDEAQAELRSCRERKGISLDQKNDPNRTGLIGVETSFITTTLGNPAAKRTTANPEFAALLVLLLNEAGAKRGDAIAIGASGSFPALLVASLAAARALDLQPLVICSLAASQWGANMPEFTALDTIDCLNASGIFKFQPLALSIGGEKDTGEDLSAEGRAVLEQKILKSGIHLIKNPDLAGNVKERIVLYEKGAGASPLRAFINIGGNWANIGEDSAILSLRPGLVRRPMPPVSDRQGVLQKMLHRGVPVIHLLNIRGLCVRYGLPWDPVPLPKAAETGAAIYDRAAGPKIWRLILIVSYLVLILLIIVHKKRPLC